MKHLVLLLAVLSLVTACRGAGTSDPEPETGCGDCAGELAALEGAVTDLGGVGEVLRIEHVRRTPTNGDGVSLELVAADEEGALLEDDVVRLVWLSEVDPVDWVDLAVKFPDGSIESFGPYNFADEDQRADYEDRWGPRPVS